MKYDDINQFKKPPSELIMERQSHRTFGRVKLSDKLLFDLNALLGRGITGPFGHRPRLVYFNGSGEGLKGALGTYGVIRGAEHFIAAVDTANSSEQHPEDIGYALETVILNLTDRGLGTCWMGGTFSADHYGRKLVLAENERVTALTPVGVPLGRRSIIDRIFRGAAGSKNRKSLDQILFIESLDRPIDLSAATEKFPGGWSMETLDLLRWAPSASNRQPWRWVLHEDRMDLWLFRTENYRRPNLADLQRMDMGIAMCHLELIAAENDIPGHWSLNSSSYDDYAGDKVFIASWLYERRPAKMRS